MGKFKVGSILVVCTGKRSTCTSDIDCQSANKYTCLVNVPREDNPIESQQFPCGSCVESTTVPTHNVSLPCIKEAIASICLSCKISYSISGHSL